MTRMLAWISLILLWLSVPCTAQTKPLETQTKPMAPALKAPSALPTGRITGTVLCSDTRKPARGALLMLLSKPESGSNARQTGDMARVGMDGLYSFDHVPPAEYAVVTALPGYLSALDGLVLTDGEEADSDELMWKRAAASGSVTVGGDTARLDISLRRGAIITGRVLYSDGSPATQVTLQAEDVRIKDAEKGGNGSQLDIGGMLRIMLTHQSLGTDDQGHYRIAGLRAGTYRIAAVQSSGGVNQHGGDEGGDEVLASMGLGYDPLAVRVYSGDTVHKAAAKTYEVREGDEVSGVDITLPVAAFHVVHGSVSAKDGRRLNMGDVTLTDATDDAIVYKTSLGRDGTFLFPAVTHGSYKLAVSDARIGMVQGHVPADNPYAGLVPVNAFVDMTTDVNVGDNDVQDVLITAAEMPLPKNDRPAAIGAPPVTAPPRD